MSDHAWILENLAAYLTGGLEPAERERLEQHTADCVACAAALSDARGLDAALSGLFVEARPSAVLEDRIIQTLRTRLTVRRLTVPTWLGISAAALVLIGFTGAVANQILLNNGLSSLASSVSPNGSMGIDRFVYEGKSGKDVDELAADARKEMETELERKKALPEGGEAFKNGEDAKESKDSKPPEAVPQFGMAMGGALPPGSGGGMGGERSAGGRKTNPTQQYMANPSQGYLSGAPAITYRGFLATDDVVVSQGFQPGKMLNQPLADKAERNRNENSIQSHERLDSLIKKQPKQDREIFQRDKDAKGSPPAKDAAKKLPAEQPPEQPGPRKIIIRTGEIEYEVQSFDAAVASITRLVKNIKGGFIATVNSDKLANGKVRGSVVVRVPPENLDELILELRTNLGKSGELKNQRIGSLDITKQYTDLESELKAARAMEERLLQIIKTGKGEIKDLLAAEKELGNWRTRIEKIEGELRYYANQVALSTLTITLYEKEITAPFAIIEREQVQMGIEVEDVDQAMQAAQKAVREAKGRITRAELKQPSQGQFSALLAFEVAPDAAGPLRDTLKQLGTVARFDISRQEESEGAPPSSPPTVGGGTKIKRADTRFHVHFYNLTDVPPRETVFLNLACVDVEAAMKTLLARVEKAAGRILSSNLTSTRGTQTQGDLQFQVKTTLADAVLEDIKSAGEVMALQVREINSGTGVSPVVETTRKKRGFQVKLWALEAATARETDELQLACTDVAVSYRLVQEAVLKAKGRVRIAQLNEQDRRQVTATLDFEVRRADEDGIRAALLKAGGVYTRKTSRAADAENVVDSKVHWQVTFVNQANIPPRETYKFGIEVADVDRTAAVLSALAGKHDGRILKADIARDRKGQVIGELIYDVPMAQVHELLDELRSAGNVRVQQSVKHPEVPDSPLAVARLDVTLSNTELIVPSDDGFGPNVRRGLGDSLTVLSWSLRILILGLCVLLPWALVIWGIYRLVMRLRLLNRTRMNTD